MFGMAMESGFIDAVFTVMSVVGLMMLSLGSVLLYDPPTGTTRDTWFEKTPPAVQTIPVEPARKHRAAS